MKPHPLKTTYRRSMLIGTLLSSIGILLLITLLIYTGNNNTRSISYKRMHSEIWLNKYEFQEKKSTYAYPNSETENPIPNPGPNTAETLITFPIRPVRDLSLCDINVNLQYSGKITGNFDGPSPTLGEGPIFNKSEVDNIEKIISNHNNNLFPFANSDKPPDEHDPKISKPLLIKFNEPIKYPPNFFGLTDTIIVLIYIGSDSRIIKIETIYNSHPELGFDVAFKTALYDAYIEAEVINGTPVGGRYYLYWITRSNGPQKISNSDNVHLTFR